MMKTSLILLTLIAAACVSQQELPSDVANGGTGSGTGGNVNGGSGGSDAGPTAGAGGNSSTDANDMPAMGGAGGMPKLDAMMAPQGNAKVIKVQPGNNAEGVSETTPIVLTFDSPMDRESVTAAFSVGMRRAADFTFSWNTANTEMTAKPVIPFEYASGALGSMVLANRFTINFSNAAKDAQGRPLEMFTSTFRTLRVFEGTGMFMRDQSASTLWHCNYTCSAAAATYRVSMENFRDELCVGPTYIPPAGAYFWEEAFVYFKVSGLPMLYTLRSASVTFTQTSLSEAPLMGREIAVDVATYPDIPKSVIPLPPKAQGNLSTALVVRESANLTPSPLSLGAKTAQIRDGAAASLGMDQQRLKVRLRLSPDKPWEPTGANSTQTVCYGIDPGPTLKFSIEVP